MTGIPNVRGYPSLMNETLEKHLGQSFRIQKIKFQSRQCHQQQDPAHRPTLQTPGAVRSERNARRLRNQSTKEVHFPKLKQRRNSISRRSSTSRGSSFHYCQTPIQDVRPISALSGVSVSNWRPGSMSSGFVSPEHALMKHSNVWPRKVEKRSNKFCDVYFDDEKEEKRRGCVKAENQSSSSGSGEALNKQTSSNSDNADGNKDRMTKKDTIIKETGTPNKYGNFRYPFYSGFRNHEARFKKQLSREPTPQYNFETYDRDEPVGSLGHNEESSSQAIHNQRKVVNNQLEVNNGNETSRQSQSQISNDLDTSRRSQPDISNECQTYKTVVAKVNSGAVKRTPKKDKRDEMKKPKEPPKNWHQRNELLPCYAQEGCTLYCVASDGKDGNENNVALQYVIQTLKIESERSELEGPGQPPVEDKNMSKATEKSNPIVDNNIHHGNIEIYETETVNPSKLWETQIDRTTTPSGRMSKNDRRSTNTPSDQISKNHRDNEIITSDNRMSQNDRDTIYSLRHRMLQSDRDTNNLSPRTPQQQRLANAFSSSVNPDHQAYLSESSGKSSPRTSQSETFIGFSMLHSDDIENEASSSSCSLVSQTSQPTMDKGITYSTTDPTQEIRSSTKCSDNNCEEKSVCNKTPHHEDSVKKHESSLFPTKSDLTRVDSRVDPSIARSDNNEEQAMSQQARSEQTISQQVMSQQAMSQQVMPHQVMSQQIRSQQAMSQQVMSQQAMSQQAMSQQVMSQQAMSQQVMSQQAMLQQPMSEQAMSQNQSVYKTVASNGDPEDDKSYFRNSTTEEEYLLTNKYNFETHTLKDRYRTKNRKGSTKVHKQELRPAINQIDDQILLKSDLDGILDDHAAIDTTQGENVDALASTLHRCPGSWQKSLHKMQKNLDSGVASTNTSHNIIESLMMLKMKRDALCFSDGSGMCVQGKKMMFGCKDQDGNSSTTQFVEMENSLHYSENCRSSNDSRVQYERCHWDAAPYQNALLCGQCKYEMTGPTEMSIEKQIFDVEGKNTNVYKEVCRTKCIHGKKNNCKICNKVFGWIEKNESICQNTIYYMY